MTACASDYANRLNARASTACACGPARPGKTKTLPSFARSSPVPTADAQGFEAACRLVAAQIDILDIREARLPLLARALEDRAAINLRDA